MSVQKNGTRATRIEEKKKTREGGEKREETLAHKPHDFEKPGFLIGVV